MTVNLNTLKINIMTTKIKKTTTKYIVESSEGIFEFDDLERAEKKVKSLNRSELEGYLIKQEFLNNNLVEEIFIG